LFIAWYAEQGIVVERARADAYQAAAWKAASETIARARALARLASVRLDPKVVSSLRVLERTRARADRGLGI
jgi:hypothetical protein